MTKGKKWTLRLLGVAALALLICLCLVGSTMARYTSTGDGSGTLTVALWDLETVKVEWEDTSLSPSDKEYGQGSGDNGARINASGEAVELVSLVNNSYVDAEVTVSLGDELDLEPADGFEWGEGFGDEYNQEANLYGQKLMDHFESDTAFLEVVNAYGIITIDLTSITLTSSTGSETLDNLDDPVIIEAGYSLTINGDVVWASIDENNSQTDMTYEDYSFESWAEFSDAVDTILGMYYTGITFSVTWEAVQASVQPI